MQCSASARGRLIDFVEGIVREGRNRVGGDIALLEDGPCGEWKVRYEWARRRWDLKIYAPKGFSVDGKQKIYHSMKGVDKALGYWENTRRKCDSPSSPTEATAAERYGGGNDSGQHHPQEVCSYSGGERCALIATAVAALAARRAQRRFDLIRCRIESLHHELAAEARKRDTAMQFFYNACHSSVKKGPPTPSPISSLSSYSTIDTPYPSDLLLPYLLLTHFHIWREEMKQRASECLSRSSPKKGTNAYDCPRCILRFNHWPILVGTLPLPVSLLRVATLSSREVHIMPTSHTISPSHSACLKCEFSKEREQKLKRCCAHVPFYSFDVYVDARMEEYSGSVVLQRLVGREFGLLVPVLYIENIVSRTKGKGTGCELLEVCKKLLFSDIANPSYGYIFAQCLSLPFWSRNMDVTYFAKCLCFQMSQFYPRSLFEIYTDCTPMSLRVDFIEDCPSSPSSKKPKYGSNFSVEKV